MLEGGRQCRREGVGVGGRASVFEGGCTRKGGGEEDVEGSGQGGGSGEEREGEKKGNRGMETDSKTEMRVGIGGGKEGVRL